MRALLGIKMIPELVRSKFTDVHRFERDCKVHFDRLALFANVLTIVLSVLNRYFKGAKLLRIRVPLLKLNLLSLGCYLTNDKCPIRWKEIITAIFVP